MTLLADIQAAAIDPSRSLADLLRQCQILAARLKHDPFRQWVLHELNGYSNDDKPPPYRMGLRGQVKADLAGGFGASAKNVPVPMSLFPEEMRDQIETIDFYQSVAALESLVAETRSGGGSAVMLPFPSEMAAMMHIWQGYQTLTMWNELAIPAIVGVLDQIRSRALEFCLEIEAANPDVGATSTGEPPVPLQQADAIFNTTIYGGQVAVGPGATVNVTTGDLPGLLAFLEGHGVTKADRDALEAALESDAAETHEGLGPRVQGWLGGMAAKAVSMGGAIGAEAAGGLIAGAVLRYLGLA